MLKTKNFFKPYTRETVVDSLSKMFEAVLELMLPLFMGRIIDGCIINVGVNRIKVLQKQ